jgi:hypothetical protein
MENLHEKLSKRVAYLASILKELICQQKLDRKFLECEYIVGKLIFNLLNHVDASLLHRLDGSGCHHALYK